jgi:REP element-mobilizing transposase RayT
VFIMNAHVVSVTKCRHQVFRFRHLERLEQIMRDG